MEHNPLIKLISIDRILLLQTKRTRMHTLKSCPSRKESKRLATTLSDVPQNIPSLTKLHSYPPSKMGKNDSSILSRKLLDQVKILTQENQTLKSRVSQLEQENKELYLKWKQSESLKSLMDESRVLLTSIEEIKLKRRLSESFICCSEVDKSSIGILGKIDEADEHTQIENLEPLSKIESPFNFDSLHPTKNLQQELRSKISAYESKIDQLLTMNHELECKAKAYKQKYLQLRDHFNNALRLASKKSMGK